jgi:hypothetical protein
MTLHRLLCKFGIHEWSRESRNFTIQGGATWVRACWCCGANETTRVEEDVGSDSPGSLIFGMCKCPQCQARKQLHG